MHMSLHNKLSFGALAILSIFCLAGCESQQQRQQKADQAINKSDDSNVENEVSGGQYFENDAKHKAFQSQQGMALKNVAKQMNQNYKTLGSVKYEKPLNTITLNMDTKQSKQVFKYLKLHNNQAEKFWNKLTVNFKKASRNISKQVKDPSLNFYINDDSGNTVYITKNGRQISNKY